jgi:3-deoxy-D-arabino-heptulosonate 7-phosphate (DAHP) synthase class II
MAISRVTPGEVVQELVERVAAFEIVEQRSERDASTSEYRLSAHNLWITDDDRRLHHIIQCAAFMRATRNPISRRAIGTVGL